MMKTIDLTCNRMLSCCTTIALLVTTSLPLTAQKDSDVQLRKELTEKMNLTEPLLGADQIKTYLLDLDKDFGTAAKDLVQQHCVAVCRSEYAELTNRYIENFRIRDIDGYWEIANPSVSFPWEQLRDKVYYKAPVGFGTQKAIIAHYGLAADSSFRLGIEIVVLTPDAQGDWDIQQESDLNDRFYIIEDHEMRWMQDKRDWDPYRERYRNIVYVNRAASGDILDALGNCDHLSYVMPWQQEVAFLELHNLPPKATTLPRDINVVFSNGAQLFTHLVNDGGSDCIPTESLRQVSIIHLEGLLNDDNHPHQAGRWYHRRGVDLGTPCPPRCKKYIEPNQPQSCLNRGRCKIQ